MRGFHGLRKGIKYQHILGICFVVFVLILPNTFLAIDAATPPSMDEKVFGKGFQGAFGNSVGQQVYWADVCHWLSQQDTEIENPAERPGILTWWDYGFYLSAMSGHPTVADNFQNGIQPASNFHTAQSEEEAVAVLIIRLTDGVKEPKGLGGKLSQEAKNVIRKHFPTYTIENNETGNETVDRAQLLIDILEDPTNNAPSSHTLISPEYGNTQLQKTPWNAMYHDATDIIMELDDEEITNLYMDMMEATGYSIRYYGIESRDMRSIFGVFPFLSDKSIHGHVTLEDDWYKTVYVDTKTNREYTESQLNNMTPQQFSEMDITTRTIRKQLYFNSMAFRTFYGFTPDNTDPENRIPTYMMRHFRAVYITPYVSIAKYYEGAKVNGTVKVGGLGYDGSMVFVLDEYGIPHDFDIVKNGKFELITPAGEITLMLHIGQNSLDKEISLGMVSEEEATRQVESNYTANFEVNLSSINITVTGVYESNMNLTISSQVYPSMQFGKESITNSTYEFKNLIPDNYNIIVTNRTGTQIVDEYIFIQPDANSYNISLTEELE